LLSYEDPLLEYLASFPKVNNLPTIPDDDVRYLPGGEGRILFASTYNVSTTGGGFTNGVTTVELPTGIFGTLTGTVTIAPISTPNPALPGLTSTLVVNIDFAAANDDPITQTDRLYTITLTYDEEALEAAGINELTLRAYFYDETSGTWINPTAYPPCRLAGYSQTLDAENNTMTLVLDHASRFALAGSDTLHIRIPIIVNPE
jgi:hypothetical protein